MGRQARSLMEGCDSFPVSQNIHITAFVNGGFPAMRMMEREGQFVRRNCCPP
jgi:hypothetical protein